MLQVTRSMFDKAMPHIERAIDQCQFYAFDLEMTGLHVSDQRESWVDDMEDRYRVVRLDHSHHLLLYLSAQYYNGENE